MSPEARRWRIGLLTATGVAVVLWFLGTFSGSALLPWCADLGFRASYTTALPGRPYAEHVTSVENGGAAAAAGVKAGDEIDLREIGFRERWALRDAYYGGIVGRSGPLRYRIRHGALAKTIVITPRPIVVSRGWDDWLAYAAWLWTLLVAGFLAVRRPDLLEVRLLAVVLLTGFAQGPLQDFPLPSYSIDFAYTVVVNVLSFALPAALVAVLILRYARPLSRSRRLLGAATIASAAVCGVAWLTWYASVATLFPVSPVSSGWLWETGVGANGVALLLAVACCVAATAAGRGVERRRALWIAASFGVAWIPLGWLGIALALGFPPGDLGSVPFVLVRVAQIAMPLGLTYAIFTRRLLDAHFVVNRAAVFAGVSTILVGAFVLVEWLFGGWLQGASHAANVLVTAGLVLVLGLSVRFVHAHVDRFVDNVFFRKRHEDEQAIRMFSQEAPYITDTGALLARTSALLERHTDATSVGVILNDGNGHFGNTDENDPAIVRLRTTHRIVDLHSMESQLHGDLAFPMVARGRLVGLVILGARSSGEAYAPDEAEAIAHMAQAVGASLDVLAGRENPTVTDLQTAIADLRAAIAALPGALAEKLDQRLPREFAP